MNTTQIDEAYIISQLLDDIKEYKHAKERFDAIVRYELFMRGVWQHAQAECLRAQHLPRQ